MDSLASEPNVHMVSGNNREEEQQAEGEFYQEQDQHLVA
jgi:hypothetical protein